jgi:hypothetical protein
MDAGAEDRRTASSEKLARFLLALRNDRPAGGLM